MKIKDGEAQNIGKERERSPCKRSRACSSWCMDAMEAWGLSAAAAAGHGGSNAFPMQRLFRLRYCLALGVAMTSLVRKKMMSPTKTSWKQFLNSCQENTTNFSIMVLAKSRFT